MLDENRSQHFVHGYTIRAPNEFVLRIDKMYDIGIKSLQQQQSMNSVMS
jgi:hypothetical protein